MGETYDRYVENFNKIAERLEESGTDPAILKQLIADAIELSNNMIDIT